MFADEQHIWHYKKPEKDPPPVSWDDQAFFHKQILRSITFSEFDKKERPGYYFYEVDIPANVQERNLMFIQTNFIQSYSVNTRKGNEKFDCGMGARFKLSSV